MVSSDSSANVEGKIQIHDYVITSIVRNVASRIKGVSRISGNPIINNIADIMGSKSIRDRSISVQMGKTNVSIELSVNLFFGYKLPEVAADLQLAIDSEIKKITGLQVHKVDVIIRELDEPVEER